MTSPRILIAGIGNIFLGDDAFGSEVARQLLGRAIPDGVRVVDYGIRGLDLTYALLDGYAAAILVDTVQRGGSPGTLYVIEPEPGDVGEPDPNVPLFDPHGMDPAKVLRTLTSLGGQTRRILLVGCEPAEFGSEEDPAMGLSEPVEAAVGEAVRLIDSLVAQLLTEECVQAAQLA